MLTRRRGYLQLRTEPVPATSQQLQDEGWTVVKSVVSAADIAALTDEIEAIYQTLPRDGRHAKRPAEEDEDFRYEMLNRSALCQDVIGARAILDAIEPLLGEDCHVIANTCWRNPPREINTHGGGFWHIDAGPHIPRPADIPWDDRIPYPVFAIGAHIYLKDCPLECGPTGVIPGSHKSGQRPPEDQVWDVDLTCNGRGVVPLLAKAGDVAMFVSDVWHRRLPALPGDTGRLFLQAHYGRRDIAQRIRPTSAVNHLSDDAIERAQTPRQRTLVGLHNNFFYDG
jgi:ectoine hydroxylase-related dioxygenase (phytanoyl-CoA dioxygenase family)